jgi:hypothetical protein
MVTPMLYSYLNDNTFDIFIWDRKAFVRIGQHITHIWRHLLFPVTSCVNANSTL